MIMLKAYQNQNIMDRDLSGPTFTNTIWQTDTNLTVLLTNLFPLATTFVNQGLYSRAAMIGTKSLEKERKEIMLTEMI